MLKIRNKVWKLIFLLTTIFIALGVERGESMNANS